MGQCNCLASDEEETFERTDILKSESESKHENRPRRLSGGSFSYITELKDASVVCDILASKLSKGVVADLNLSNNVITLSHSSDSKDAVQILLKNKIRAAPVIDNNNNFIGVLDLRDTLQFSLEQYRINENKSHSNSKPNESISKSFKFRNFVTVKVSDNLLTVANILAAGAHIVGVLSTDNDKELIGIIKQADLFQYACTLWGDATNNCSLQDLLNLNYITSPIHSIEHDASAFDAFSTMSDLNLSGLPVVDGSGKLIHNTSSTDIELWLLSKSKANHNISLQAPIEEFLINIRQQPALIEKYPVTFCTLKQTLRRALSKLQATKYHRLWIVNNETHPIGVLALTDIFKFICKVKKN